MERTFHVNSNFFKSSSGNINNRQTKFQDKKCEISKEKYNILNIKIFNFCSSKDILQKRKTNKKKQAMLIRIYL